MGKTFEITYWLSFGFGITLAYFIWLTWHKLTEIIGDSTKIWIVTGIIVLFGIFTERFTIKKIVEKFT